MRTDKLRKDCKNSICACDGSCKQSSNSIFKMEYTNQKEFAELCLEIHSLKAENERLRELLQTISTSESSGVDFSKEN